MTTESSSEADQDWSGGSDRRQEDRRARPTRIWDGFISPMRRASGRRAEDHSSYVDRYTKRDVLLLLTIFILNVADAFFTMMWLNRGGKEANPVMDFFLDIGPSAFLIQKCLVVGGWLILLLAHKNFRFARLGLYASLAVYSALLLVHFGILYFGIEPPKTISQADSNEVHGALPDGAQQAILHFQGSPAISPVRDDLAAWRPGRAMAAATAFPSGIPPLRPTNAPARAE